MLGAALKLGHRLRWHRIGPVSLGYWPLLLGLLWLALAWGTVYWPCALALSAAGLLLLGVMLGARRQGYIRFKPDESLAAYLPPDVAPVDPDEKVPVRVTGMLEVRDNRRLFVEAAADVVTMEIREHIIMARIPLSRMWLVAQSPKSVVGWWYAFIKPAHIRSIQTGWLHYGLHPRPALALVYERRKLIEGKKKARESISEETIYISAAKPLVLHRLLENLARDAGQPVDSQQYVPL